MKGLKHLKIFRSLYKFKNSRTFIILLGISATIWFLIRVIPKPSRALYPCMKAAAPLMSTFVIYLLGISASVFSYKKFKQSVKSSRYAIAGLFMLLSLFSFSLLLLKDPQASIAAGILGVDETYPIPSNDPVGEAKGLYPGRVVWVQDAGATKESYDPRNAGSYWWWNDYITDQVVVKKMLDLSIKKYAEKDDIGEAWAAIFIAFNESHGRGSVGYTAGEKIAVKINLTNQCCASAERMDATPQLVNALLHELIVNVGVDPGDITLGDPYREFRNEYVSLVAVKYPGVNFVDGNGGAGVDKTVPSTEEVLVFSDKQYKSTLPKYYQDATYFINMPCLKTHDVGGITLIAKNHQGSYLPKGDDPKDQFAILMHYSLPKESRGQGNYRHTVDYMGHEETGGKGLIYIIDGIWGGENWEGLIKKFKSAPFNNDYPNSIFVGQDPVALESVGFDILFEESVQDNDKKPYPITYKDEVADYLLQCASSSYWPNGIEYDPEGDGTLMGSLGVFEHWNNPNDRQYSRNLGSGNGVELNYYNAALVNNETFELEALIDVAPNPFSTHTVFRSVGELSDNSILGIYSINGQLVNEFSFDGSEEIRWNGTDAVGNLLANGIYVYTVSDRNSGKHYSGKVALSR